MLDIATAIMIAVPVSLWLGFFVERSYRQATTYNLLGKAAKRGISTKRVDSVVSKNFGKWNWISLSAFFMFAAAAVYIFMMSRELNIYVILSVLCSVISVIYCLYNLSKYYKRSNNELFEFDQ